MRIICKKSNLVKGVSIVSKAVPSKTTMPILECILIDATTDVIKLTANDMELGIETTIDGIIDSRGIIALNAKIFSEIVRKLPDNDVVIETESDNQAIITCEKAKFNIAAQSGDDFSYLPAIEREDFITISEFTLKEVVRQTIFSIADNDTNKMMTGELFEIDNDVLRVVSLDGHRISIRKIELKDAYQPRKVIVPGKTLQEISKIIGGEADAEVEISFTKNHIVFASLYGFPFVRVLLTLDPNPVPADLPAAKERYEQLCSYAANKNVRVLVESCGLLSDSAKLATFIADACPESRGVLWDIQHPFRNCAEKPKQTVANLGKEIR